MKDSEKKTSGTDFSRLSEMDIAELNALFDDLTDAFARGEEIDGALYRAVAEELEKRDPLPGGKISNEAIGETAIGRCRALVGKDEPSVFRRGRARILIAVAAAVLLTAAVAVLIAALAPGKAPMPSLPATDAETQSVTLAEHTEKHSVRYKIMSQFRSIESLPGSPAYTNAFPMEDYALWSWENTEKHKDPSAPRTAAVQFGQTTYEGTYAYTYMPQYSDHFVHGYQTVDGSTFEVSADDGLLERLCPRVPEDLDKKELSVSERFIRARQFAYALEPSAGTIFNDHYAKLDTTGECTYRFLSRLSLKEGESIEHSIELAEYIEVTVNTFGDLLWLDAPMRGKLVKEDMTDLFDAFSDLHARSRELVEEKEREQYGSALLETVFYPSAVVTKLTDGAPAVVYICFETISADFIKDPELRKSVDESFDVTVIYILLPDR